MYNPNDFENGKFLLKLYTATDRKDNYKLLYSTEWTEDEQGERTIYFDLNIPYYQRTIFFCPVYNPNNASNYYGEEENLQEIDLPAYDYRNKVMTFTMQYSYHIYNYTYVLRLSRDIQNIAEKITDTDVIVTVEYDGEKCKKNADGFYFVENYSTSKVFKIYVSGSGIKRDFEFTTAGYNSTKNQFGELNSFTIGTTTRDNVQKVIRRLNNGTFEYHYKLNNPPSVSTLYRLSGVILQYGGYYEYVNGKNTYIPLESVYLSVPILFTFNNSAIPNGIAPFTDVEPIDPDEPTDEWIEVDNLFDTNYRDFEWWIEDKDGNRQATPHTEIPIDTEDGGYIYLCCNEPFGFDSVYASGVRCDILTDVITNQKIKVSFNNLYDYELFDSIAFSVKNGYITKITPEGKYKAPVFNNDIDNIYGQVRVVEHVLPDVPSDPINGNNPDVQPDWDSPIDPNDPLQPIRPNDPIVSPDEPMLEPTTDGLTIYKGQQRLVDFKDNISSAENSITYRLVFGYNIDSVRSSTDNPNVDRIEFSKTGEKECLMTVVYAENKTTDDRDIDVSFNAYYKVGNTTKRNGYALTTTQSGNSYIDEKSYFYFVDNDGEYDYNKQIVYVDYKGKNIGPFYVDNPVDWLYFYLDGTTDRFVLDLKENATESDREALITVRTDSTLENKAIFQTYHVVQKKNNGQNLILDKYRYDLNWDELIFITTPVIAWGDNVKSLEIAENTRKYDWLTFAKNPLTRWTKLDVADLDLLKYGATPYIEMDSGLTRPTTIPTNIANKVSGGTISIQNGTISAIDANGTRIEKVVINGTTISNVKVSTTPNGLSFKTPDGKEFIGNVVINNNEILVKPIGGLTTKDEAIKSPTDAGLKLDNDGKFEIIDNSKIDDDGNLNIGQIAGITNENLPLITDNPTNVFFGIWVYAENTTDSDREAVLTIVAKDASGAITTTREIVIVQHKREDIIEFPIWDERHIDIPTNGNDYVNYKIVKDNHVIYTGTAYSEDRQTATIVVNNICKDYINSNIDFNELYITNGFGLFELYYSSDNWETSLKLTDIYIYNDWSYIPLQTTYGERPYQFFASYPINYILDKRQRFLFTTFNSNVVPPFKFKVKVFKGNMNKIQMIDTFVNSVGMDTDIINLKDMSFNVGDEFISLGVYTKNEKLEWNTTSTQSVLYKVSTCNDYKYCLYYLNSFGGWDSLLIDGKTVESTSMKNYSYTDKNKLNKPYLKESKRKWKLNSNWLTDEQSRRMMHLLESVNVYLHDLEKDEICPIVITNTSYERKEFKNVKKPISYQIDVEEQRTKLNYR